MTTNALTASDSVIIPVQCEFLLWKYNATVKYNNVNSKEFKSNFDIEGVLLTMLDSRTNLGLKLLRKLKVILKREYMTQLFLVWFISEAPSHGKPIIVYDPQSRGTEAYINLAKEGLREMENKKKALGMGLEQLFNNENLNIEKIEKQFTKQLIEKKLLI